ncbi:hypothetical protein [Actinomadura formosensis]|uniref:hypothetical protein n=1 Tax=Actinomadura formosensis TaxID=60706 RepID=UPI003D92EF2E
MRGKHGRRKTPSLGKILGIAGFIGVTAAGTMVVRAGRRRRSRAPGEIRNRRHERPVEASGRRP